MKRMRQQGVAVITALLLTTLAVTIVAGLFWQQQVQVRLIENQRLGLQQGWLLRGTLDWARLVLSEDARMSGVDYRGEAWAAVLSATPPLEGTAVTVRAEIDDAQARFNLSNLSAAGEINRNETAMFARLLTSLRLNPQLALATAEAMAAQQRASATGARGTMRLWQVEDLLSVPGFEPAMLSTLQPWVAVLPKATAINLNTAPAEILAAKFASLSVTDAAALIASRQNAYFRDAADFTQRLPGGALPEDAGQLAFASNYFMVRSTVQARQAVLQSNALVERNGDNTRVVWLREEDAT